MRDRKSKDPDPDPEPTDDHEESPQQPQRPIRSCREEAAMAYDEASSNDVEMSCDDYVVDVDTTNKRKRESFSEDDDEEMEPPKKSRRSTTTCYTGCTMKPRYTPEEIHHFAAFVQEYPNMSVHKLILTTKHKFIMFVLSGWGNPGHIKRSRKAIQMWINHWRKTMLNDLVVDIKTNPDHIGYDYDDEVEEPVYVDDFKSLLKETQSELDAANEALENYKEMFENATSMIRNLENARKEDKLNLCSLKKELYGSNHQSFQPIVNLPRLNPEELNENPEDREKVDKSDQVVIDLTNLSIQEYPEAEPLVAREDFDNSNDFVIALMRQIDPTSTSRTPETQKRGKEDSLCEILDDSGEQNSEAGTKSYMRQLDPASTSRTPEVQKRGKEDSRCDILDDCGDQNYIGDTNEDRNRDLSTADVELENIGSHSHIPENLDNVFSTNDDNNNEVSMKDQQLPDLGKVIPDLRDILDDLMLSSDENNETDVVAQSSPKRNENDDTFTLHLSDSAEETETNMKDVSQNNPIDVNDSRNSSKGDSTPSSHHNSNTQENEMSLSLLRMKMYGPNHESFQPVVNLNRINLEEWNNTGQSFQPVVDLIRLDLEKWKKQTSNAKENTVPIMKVSVLIEKLSKTEIKKFYQQLYRDNSETSSDTNTESSQESSKDFECTNRATYRENNGSPLHIERESSQASSISSDCTNNQTKVVSSSKSTRESRSTSLKRASSLPPSLKPKQPKKIRIRTKRSQSVRKQLEIIGKQQAEERKRLEHESEQIETDIDWTFLVNGKIFDDSYKITKEATTTSSNGNVGEEQTGSITGSSQSQGVSTRDTMHVPVNLPAPTANIDNVDSSLEKDTCYYCKRTLPCRCQSDTSDD